MSAEASKTTAPGGATPGGPAPAGPKAAPRTTRVIARSPFWWLVSKVLVLGFCKLYFRLRVEGRHHVPKTGPLLLVSNHASYVDPPLVGITAGRWVGFLAQAGLAKVGPLRWWLGQMGVTLIDRDAPSKEALRVIAECLAKGEAVGIFPEGTRSGDGAVGPFRNGVEFLVRRTGATVVPIGLDGNFRAFPRKAIVPRPRKLVVRYGAPMTAAEVLAPGGVERLRARVAELAHAPLRATDAGDGGATGGIAGASAGPVRSDTAASAAPAARREAGGGALGPSSTSSSAGGGA
ncbi:MAG: lysophospholipid acyltransferase family protein [Planctomycetota bacterium]